MKRLAIATSVALIFASAGAQAALLDEHNGQLYDNVTNLVWLQDANLAASNTFGVSGIGSADGAGSMNWSTANSWIAGMNAANYLGHNDWKLPTMRTSTSQYNVTDPADQMSYMYYVNLGLTAQNGVLGNANAKGQANIGLVKNLQNYSYWTGTSYPGYADTYAGSFYFQSGYQNFLNKVNVYDVWAVRAADAADIAAAVPEPESYAMLLAGLAFVGFIGRRRKEAISA